MRFNRVLQPVYALTLDLDDTLYDNRPIIAQAEHKFVVFLENYYSGQCSWGIKDYQKLRYDLLKYEPGIYHDVTYWRWRSIKLALQIIGFSRNESSTGADSAMEILIYWRNKIYVSVDTHAILHALSNKWPLIAITNGNADLTMCGLDKYFSHVLRAGIDGRAKPYKDMYYIAAKKLGISCKNILHVGNDLVTDVYGAINCGMQVCWINEYNSGLHYVFNRSYMPHLEISKLFFLTELL